MKDELNRSHPGSHQSPIAVGGHVGQAGLDKAGHVKAGCCLMDADQGCQLPDRPGCSGHRPQHLVPGPARKSEGHEDRVGGVHLDGFPSILHRGMHPAGPSWRTALFLAQVVLERVRGELAGVYDFLK